jgi:hypothetical protein
MELEFLAMPNFDSNFIDKISNAKTSDIQAIAANLIKGPWVEVVINP